MDIFRSLAESRGTKTVEYFEEAKLMRDNTHLSNTILLKWKWKVNQQVSI